MKKHYDNDLLSEIKNFILNGHYGLAEQKIEDYKCMYPDDIIINKYHAQLLFKQGFLEEAERVCLLVINRGYHVKRLKSDMYITLSEIYHAQNKIKEAIECLERAYELKSVNTQTIQIRLSNLYIKNNERKKAMDILDKRENNSFNKNTELQKAILLFKEGKYDEALEILLDINDRDLKNKVDVQRKNIHIAGIYKSRNEYEKALMHYKNALIVKNDSYWYAYYGIGYIKYKLGYIDEAIKVLEETIKNKQTDTILETLTKCYLLKGNVDKANTIVEKMLDIDIKKLYLGRININKENYVEAEKILSDLISNNSMDEVYYSYAFYYLVVAKFRLKKYDEVLSLVDNIGSTLDLEDKYKREFNLIKFYVNKELGKEVYPINYSESQMYLYSEELAISHIKDHHYNDYRISKFSDNVNVDELFHYIRKRIDTDKRIIFGCLDKYTFDFSKDIGNDVMRNLRSVSTICLPNSDKILTMYPDRYEQIVEEVQMTSEKPKTRRLTQTEKFNKKYNLNKKE